MPKHDQWITLSRPAAEALTDRWDKFIPARYVESLAVKEKKHHPTEVRKRFLLHWGKNLDGWGRMIIFKNRSPLDWRAQFGSAEKASHNDLQMRC